MGRWWSVDPLGEKYAGWTSYNYVLGNPLNLIDPDGMRPDFQYPEDQVIKDEQGTIIVTDYATSFPILTDYLQNGISEILDNPEIMDGLMVIGGFSEEQIKNEIVKWSDGITIEVTQLGGSSANGYTPGDKSHIQIDIDLVFQLEKAKPEDRQAALLGVVSTIFHETTHEGDRRQRSGPLTKGNFEKKGDVFYHEGIVVGNSDEAGRAFETALYHNNNDGRARWIDKQGLYGLSDLKSTINKIPESKQRNIPTVPNK